MDIERIEGLPPQVIEYIRTLEQRLEKLQRQYDQLAENFRLAQKARFGSSSEKAKYILDEGYEQQSLFNEAEVEAEEEPEPVVVEAHTRRPKRTKEELTKDLPVEKVVISIPEDERKCNICEGELHPIGQELVRRELSIIPAQAYITETYRENYACDDCLKEADDANIIKPEVPAPVVNRGLASPSSAAHVMYQKFVNAVPLYRQEKDWGNFGVTISRATLANWIIYTSKRWLLPLWDAWKEILLTSPVILADETVVQVLKEEGKTPQSESRMWVYCTGNVGIPPPIILFEYQPNRNGSHANAFLDIDHEFYLLTDGYAGYNGVRNAIHARCFAHLRRKFEVAMPKNAPKDNKALIGFKYCQKLFALEDKFKDLSPPDRLEKRLKQSKPILDEFIKWVDTVNPLAGSKLAVAITYARNQREPLSAFLLDGRIELSSNRVENAIRPFAVGRKNWLFSDTVAGAQASAVAYSVIETARANGLNPYKYLLLLFSELPTLLTKNPKADLSRFFPWSAEVQENCRLKKSEVIQLSVSG